MPTEITKGVVVCRTAWGNLLVGPTAEEQEARDRATLVPETLDGLRRRGEAILPALADEEITACYAGLRPATEHGDYRVQVRPEIAYASAGGIRSTGLSSALGTARHLFALCEPLLGVTTPIAEPHLPAVANISESAPRDWEKPGNGGIVCHCEAVTRREIEAVMEGPMAPRSLAGLKRRTRVTMGRCQGFYCSSALAALTAGRLDAPLASSRDAAG